ncbi:2-C-methyl-D-erythritol 2,4-cyclodiphosphate synthase [Leptospira licerasiae]|uniref:2-C-methyl-D-erythritol 2,4-cyclodiphosphate synthase n=1 Tax=Leptospira licerasiae str. MMD4847 TaxID=1049971 RepID=A0ABN0H588_9LEPT|nr:2-C-methyl-D-erythritol 2,4-cyclodiphosphate synthase [Leptospira licerasiae]EIE02409.1 2-C-methyl-D-erythritol 2,4-cyclodiphosphate synthase [Leptospira licerasiae serovar Varillal str. VAR 010]EJZ41018.1 2-C-methyl-D-erythritol 2,4-cyclodiphosphate synthase [Leptospira licerasiae str. MMD4847]
MYRIGQGLDFHRLETNQTRPLILGGAIIDSEYALIGHSDADIVIHALADAILGAMGLGDIGQYFPDTDPSLKNMDSKLILQKVLDLAKEKNFSLVNIDCTLIGERPKIAPHRIKIQSSLSNLLGLPEDCVSVKATTTEKMGALGRTEGLGASCVVLLQKN